MKHLRAVIGFGADRGYAFDEFLRDASTAGFEPDLLLSTWDLRPFDDDADFLAAVLSPARNWKGVTEWGDVH